MRFEVRPAAALLALSLLAGPAAAQTASVDFGGLIQDTSAPVEVEADSLSIDQAAGNAVFEGNVLVVQETMRMTAPRVEVDYAPGGGAEAIRQITATGGVTLANETEAAEAQEAVYDVEQGNIVMTGDVLLTQGSTALAGQRLTLDLDTGTGRMEGRVRTVFQPGAE